MDARQKSLRIGIAALLCGMIFRFFSPGMLDPVLRFLSKPQTVAFLIYAETGHRVRLSPAGEVLPEQIDDGDLCFAWESPPPALPDWVYPTFPDPASLSVDYGCSYRPDIEMLLQQPLSWNLRGKQPTVLIYHTHTTESYQRLGADYEETAPYRTLDNHYNIVAIGDRITEMLEQAGICVLHDRQVHDYPSFNTAYVHSRNAAKELLKKHPGIQLVLDLHRDAIEGPEGQMKTTANLGGSTSAQLMIVVGTNSRVPHSKWPRNLSLGLKLQAQLQQQTPGIVRPLQLTPQRFNQDLSPGALLIEVGAAGNSHREALLAGEELARAIIALSRGTGPTADWEETAADPPAAPEAGF